VLDHLCPREMLLVLDNCEHVLESCATLATTLLTGCPRLRLLATSRQSLGITGELAWRVPSLAVPATAADSAPSVLRECPSVQLFVERARQVQPAFDPSPETLSSVGRICRQLDGIPFAIELSAARVRSLPVAEIVSRLDDRFRLLTVGSRTALPRHQTLRATMDWSYRLLTPAEQTLLRRLAVFAGGFTLEAAETITVGAGLAADAILDLLAQLVDKSLVIPPEAAGAPRYRLLEIVRQYAREHLEASGDIGRVRDRHRDYFVGMAEEAEPFIFGGVTDRRWLGRLEDDIDNVRAAFEWSRETPDGAETGLRLAAAIHWFWFASGRIREGWRRTAAALARSREGSPNARARALTASAFIAFWQGDIAAMEMPLTDALAIVRATEDRWSIAYTLCALGAAANFRSEPRAARAFLEEAVATARTQSRRVLVPFVQWWHGLVAQAQGDYDAARAAFEEGLAVGREECWLPAISHVGYMLGRLHLALGAHDEAAPHYRESLELLHEMDDRWGIANVLDGLVRLAAWQGEPDRAARLGGASAALRETLGAALLLPDHDESKRALAEARTALGVARFDALHAEGRAMTLAQTVTYALKR
jgi:predicted ATPase